VTFPTTGREFSSDVNFDTGLTAITGSNEAGKSLHLEFIAFALYGSKALRGEADDYKTLKVEMEFSVRDARYRIFRNGSKVTLHQGDTPLTSGTKAVNAAVVRLLGYDWTVFKMANLTCQGEVVALGNMTPSARRAAVDQTIGLDVLDDLAGWAGDQVRTSETEAVAIERVMGAEPIEPARPEGYRPVDEIRLELEQLRVLDQERMEIEAWLKTRPTLGEKPVPPCPETAKELEAQVDARRAAALELAALRNQIAAIPDATLSEEEITQQEAAWETYHASQEKQKALAGLVKPGIRREVAISLIEQWQRRRRWEDFQALLKRVPKPERPLDEVLQDMHTWNLIDRFNARDKLLSQGEHICPACGHHWPVAADALKMYADLPTNRPASPELPWTELERIGRAWSSWDAAAEQRATLECEEVDIPGASEADAREVLRRWEAWDASASVRAQYQSVPDNAPKPLIAEAALRRARIALSQMVQKAELDKRAAAIALPADREPDLLARRRYETELSHWEEAHRQLEAWQVEEAKKTFRLRLLTNIPGRIASAQARVEAAQRYEIELEAYQARARQWQQHSTRSAELRASAGHWQAARKAIGVLRSKVKGYLVPSLNKVASSLLYQMTGGTRSSIVVTEDFEITVDGQALRTLSGSAKAVANLALRVALGLVLTNRVFSVFMGDEVDEAMDADRAGFTAEAFSALSSTIKQILLVSHKDIDADNEIRVGA
jgi:DNA repair exonuclease SbcCD ATPase subunit